MPSADNIQITMAALIAAITYYFHLNLSGVNYGDLPNDPVRWAAVFILSIYSLGGIDDHIWRHENP